MNKSHIITTKSCNYSKVSVHSNTICRNINKLVYCSVFYVIQRITKENSFVICYLCMLFTACVLRSDSIEFIGIYFQILDSRLNHPNLIKLLPPTNILITSGRLHYILISVYLHSVFLKYTVYRWDLQNGWLLDQRHLICHAQKPASNTIHFTIFAAFLTLPK